MLSLIVELLVGKKEYIRIKTTKLGKLDQIQSNDIQPQSGIEKYKAGETHTMKLFDAHYNTNC